MTLLRRSFLRGARAWFAVAALIGLWTGDVEAGQQPAPAAPPASTQDAQAESYKLGPGDKLRVIVFGEEDLGGEFQIDGSGLVRLPLIDEMRAAGLTAPQFGQQVKQKLDDGYLKDARVSVEVITYRPFYIIGEVSKPGEYPYVNGMSVLTAVAVAGGYTYRANSSSVFIRRNGTTAEVRAPADQTTKINPGDIIRVRERFF